jgi:hypothetical protein
LEADAAKIISDTKKISAPSKPKQLTPVVIVAAGQVDAPLTPISTTTPVTPISTTTPVTPISTTTPVTPISTTTPISTVTSLPETTKLPVVVV